MNQAEIIGTSSDEPRMSEGPNGPIAALSVVTKHKRPTEDGFTEEATQYHRVAVFTRSSPVPPRVCKPALLCISKANCA